MNIAVTGGAGFLGYHLAHKLSRQGENLHLLDIADFHHDGYNGTGPGKVTWENADVLDLSAMERALKGADVAVHAASAFSASRPATVFATNIQGTINVLRAAHKNGLARLVFISSASVYGTSAPSPIYETDKLIGNEPCSKSKIRAEEMCNLARDRGMVVTVLRPRPFLGAGHLGVFQMLYDWIQGGKSIPMPGNGRTYYQLLDVSDLVYAIYLAATRPKHLVNDTFNVGATQFSTIRGDVSALCAYAGTGAVIATTPAGMVMPTLKAFDTLNPSPLYRWVYDTANKDSIASTAKIEQELGWEARYSNAEALIRAYKWYIDDKSAL